MAGVLIATGIGFVVWLVFGINKMREDKKHKNESKNVFNTLEDFKPDSCYLSETSGISFSFDNERKIICFLDASHKPTFYTYNSILQCEVVEDGVSILKSSTTSTIGRSILGGILAGGVGAIIGGTTSSKAQNVEVSSLDLKIIVNDPKNPVYKINFLNFKVKKNSLIYKDYYPKIEHWHALISGLIKQGSIEYDNSAKTHVSIADELIKLKDLMDQGVITEEEFSNQKSILLGSK